jgi:starvation-inducible DNA-binding protein
MTTTLAKEYPAPKALSTPTNLDAKAAHQVTTALAGLTADCFALYVKTKNFHWHLSGQRFRDLHLLFDEQADQIFAMIDVLAERARKIGGTTIRSIGHIAELTRIKDDNESFVDANDMLERLEKDNLEFELQLRHAHEVADKADDKATTSILEIYLDETQRRIWFLFEARQR